jgi:hypothetical protein
LGHRRAHGLVARLRECVEHARQRTEAQVVL